MIMPDTIAPSTHIHIPCTICRVAVKPQGLDWLSEEVLATLNTANRAQGFKGKGVRGNLIPVEKIPDMHPVIRKAIGLILGNNGQHALESIADPETKAKKLVAIRYGAEDHYSIGHELSVAFSEAYGLAQDGRVVREAIRHTDKVIRNVLAHHALIPSKNIGLYLNV